MPVRMIDIRASREQFLGNCKMSPENRMEQQAKAILVLPVNRHTMLQKCTNPPQFALFDGFQADFVRRRSCLFNGRGLPLLVLSFH